MAGWWETVPIARELVRHENRVFVEEKSESLAIVPAKKQRDFDPTKFLATIGEGRKAVVFSKKQTIFTQGDRADAIFYIQRGKVRLSVVSQIGKEATLGILS